MKENQDETKKVQEDFQFIMRGKSALGAITKVEFRKCEFRHFSAIDNSHYKTETLSKMK